MSTDAPTAPSKPFPGLCLTPTWLQIEPVVGSASEVKEVLRNPALDTDHGEWNDEELLKENPMRFVLFPINHDAIWHMYKKVTSLAPRSRPRCCSFESTLPRTPHFRKTIWRLTPGLCPLSAGRR